MWKQERYKYMCKKNWKCTRIDFYEIYSREKDYPVYVGKESWHRLTGEVNFYLELIAAVTEVAIDVETSKVVNKIVRSLAKEIKLNKIYHNKKKLNYVKICRLYF